MVDAIDAKVKAWKSTLLRTNWTYDQFCKATEGWSVFPVRGGAVLAKGNEIHACIFPNTLDKRCLKILDFILEQYDEAVTSTELGNEIGERFVTKLGFNKTHAVGNTQY